MNQTSSPALPSTPGQLSQHRNQAPKFRLAWALLRVPALLSLIFLFRGTILTVVPDRVSALVTVLVIELASTPVARTLFFLAAVAMLAIVFLTTRRLGAIYSYHAALISVAALTLVAFHLLGTQRRLTILVVAVVATNLMPDAVYERVLVPELNPEQRRNTLINQRDIMGRALKTMTHQTGDSRSSRKSSSPSSTCCCMSGGNEKLSA